VHGIFAAWVPESLKVTNATTHRQAFLYFGFVFIIFLKKGLGLMQLFHVQVICILAGRVVTGGDQ
jgi:hypothetical protein